MKRLCLLFLSTLLLHAAPLRATTNETLSKDSCLLFAYFTGKGKDGLHLAWSADGYTWEAVPGSPRIVPELEDKIMRDPCIQQGPDGIFHMVWTTSWTKGGFGHASSPDLLQWSEQQYVPAMAHEPGVENTWAPELIWDTAQAEWLIVWSSTIRDRFPDTDPKTREAGDKILNHRLYATTTKDWKAFSPTRLFYDDNFSVIDATFAHADERVAMIIKDERIEPRPRKDLRIAWSQALQKPFGPAAPSFTSAALPLWLEGPTLVRVGDTWFLYADAYRDHHYILLTSRDLASWTDETSRLKLPKGVRHGTVLTVPKAVVEGLLRQP